MNLFNLHLVLTILKILADVGRNAHHLRVEVINTLNASTRLLHAILAVSATTGNHAAVIRLRTCCRKRHNHTQRNSSRAR